MKPQVCLVLGIVIGVAATIGVRALPHRIVQTSAEKRDLAAEAEMRRVVPRVDMVDVPFAQAIEQLRHLTSLPIDVDPAVFDDFVPPGETAVAAKVTLHEQNRTVWELAGEITSHANNPFCTFDLSDGRILIAPEAILGPHERFAFYDVTDLSALCSRDHIPVPASTPATPATAATGSLFGGGERPDDLVSFLNWALATHLRGTNTSGECVKARFNNRLLVIGTWKARHDVECVLGNLRQAMLTPVPSVQSAITANSPWSVPPLRVAMEAKLRKRLGRVDFDDVPFDKALADLSILSGVRVIRDPSMREERFDPRTPVSLHVRDQTICEVLDALLEQKIADYQLGYRVEEDHLLVSTHWQAQYAELTRVYDVRDLLPAESSAGYGGALITLIQFLEKSIAPHEWDSEKLMILNGNLIITQSWSKHQKLARMLDSMREHGMRPK